MKKNYFFIFSLLFLFIPCFTFAQQGNSSAKEKFSVSQPPCWMKPNVRVTPEQTKAIGDLQRSFYRQISGLHNQYMNIHYEIRSLLGRPRPDRKVILERQRRLSDLRGKINEIFVQYYLKARDVLTPEQSTLLPPGCYLGFNYYGYSMGGSRKR